MTLLKKPVLESWNLNDLLKSHKDKQFANLLESIEQDVKEIEILRPELTNNISNETFLSVLTKIETLIEKMSIVSGYAHLKYASDTSSNEIAALVTKMDSLFSLITNRLLFFDLWFKKDLIFKKFNSLMEFVPFEYKDYLKHKRLMGKYSLTEKEEKIINIMEVTGPNALVKIYDRMTNNFEFFMKINKNKKTIIKKFSSKEKLISLVRSADGQQRVAAYKALLETYKTNSGVLGEIYQNLVLQWSHENIHLRGFSSPISVRNISNNLDDKTVNTLLDVCRSNSSIFQEYFVEKAKILGYKKLKRYHLYAPYSNMTKVKSFSYEKAVRLVLNTFESFNPIFREYAERIFNQQHIDSQIRKGKMGGAFCSTISPKITPYVLLNYNGKLRDISTMAHEFGHAIHSMAAGTLPISVSHAPLPLAETASVFAEILLNDNMLKSITDTEKKLFLAEQIDDMYATILRQSFFTIFEIDVHNQILNNNATIDGISDIYIQNLKLQFGNSVDISDDFRYEWLYIPHFYHTPFYCYAYSFGNLLVLSLYQIFKKEGSSFIPRYLKILSAGGSQKPEDLLREAADIDITRPEFWQGGFNLVSEKIKDLKRS